MSLKLFISLIYVFELISLITFFLTNSYYEQSDFGSFCLFSIIFCPIQIILLIIGKRISVLSFPSIYLFITYLFTNSGFILYLFLGSSGLNRLRLVNYEYLSMTIPLIAIAFVSFGLGALKLNTSISKNLLSKFRLIRKKDYNYHEIILSFLCLSIFFLSLVFIAILSRSGEGLSSMFEGGYHEFSRIDKTSFSVRLLVVCLSWFLPWTTLILIALSSKSVYSLRIVSILVIICCSLLFISGDRGGALPIILIYIQIYSVAVPKFDWIKWSLILFMCFLLIPILQVLRPIPLREWNFQLFSNILTNLDKYFPSYIQVVFEPFSNSIQTLMGTLMQIRSIQDYRFGIDYILSILSAIPFNSGMAPNNGAWVKEFLSPNTVAGTGFLTVAEAYLNFSWIGIVFIYGFLGALTSRYWLILKTKTLNSLDLSLILVIFYSLTLWVRNEFSLVTRTFLWSWGLIYFLPYIISIVAIRSSRKKIMTNRTF
jgi:oligosaccharide repeat unit polymerase